MGSLHPSKKLLSSPGLLYPRSPFICLSLFVKQRPRFVNWRLAIRCHSFSNRSFNNYTLKRYHQSYFLTGSFLFAIFCVAAASSAWNFAFSSLVIYSSSNRPEFVICLYLLIQLSATSFLSRLSLFSIILPIILRWNISASTSEIRGQLNAVISCFRATSCD